MLSVVHTVAQDLQYLLPSQPLGLCSVDSLVTQCGEIWPQLSLWVPCKHCRKLSRGALDWDAGNGADFGICLDSFEVGKSLNFLLVLASAGFLVEE